MMDFHNWLSFVVTVGILCYSPGPSVLLATANSMDYGVRKNVGTILGDLSANTIQMILASAGLAAIIAASAELFYAIKWAGVSYLIYLGIKQFLRKGARPDGRTAAPSKSFLQLFWQGFAVSASNPKAIVFFSALFPIFINPDLPLLSQTFLLALTFLIIDGTSLLIYSGFASRLKTYLQDQNKMHVQNRIVGSALIIAGILLALKKRTE